VKFEEPEGKACMTPECPHAIGPYNQLHLCVGATRAFPHYKCRLCLGRPTNNEVKVVSGTRITYEYHFSTLKCELCRGTEGYDPGALRAPGSPVQETEDFFIPPTAKEYAANHPWWKKGGPFNKDGEKSKWEDEERARHWSYPHGGDDEIELGLNVDVDDEEEDKSVDVKREKEEVDADAENAKVKETYILRYH
jgi:hypothetical protein